MTAASCEARRRRASNANGEVRPVSGASGRFFAHVFARAVASAASDPTWKKVVVNQLLREELEA
ncbi:hypothetical protein LC1Hm_2408 [Halomicrobium sp. LC1Hm]|nr:hypothetical protein LC1Hm_2408 [Halomicrobium sp. LC1Hm]